MAIKFIKEHHLSTGKVPKRSFSTETPNSNSPKPTNTVKTKQNDILLFYSTLLTTAPCLYLFFTWESYELTTVYPIIHQIGKWLLIVFPLLLILTYTWTESRSLRFFCTFTGLSQISMLRFLPAIWRYDDVIIRNRFFTIIRKYTDDEKRQYIATYHNNAIKSIENSDIEKIIQKSKNIAEIRDLLKKLVDETLKKLQEDETIRKSFWYLFQDIFLHQVLPSLISVGILSAIGCGIKIIWDKRSLSDAPAYASDIQRVNNALTTQQTAIRDLRVEQQNLENTVARGFNNQNGFNRSMQENIGSHFRLNQSFLIVIRDAVHEQVRPPELSRLPPIPELSRLPPVPELPRLPPVPESSRLPPIPESSRLPPIPVRPVGLIRAFFRSGGDNKNPV